MYTIFFLVFECISLCQAQAAQTTCQSLSLRSNQNATVTVALIWKSDRDTALCRSDSDCHFGSAGSTPYGTLSFPTTTALLFIWNTMEIDNSTDAFSTNSAAVVRNGKSFTLVTDKPIVTYSEPSVAPFVNISATRYRRHTVEYFTTIHIELAVPLDDNYTVEILFYENVSNQYRRSFIEMQFKFCAFLFKDPVFGASIRKQMSIESCPLPAGSYSLYNMTAAVDHLPKLPFSKGRIYMYLKIKSKVVIKGYCDMELKRKKPPKH